MYACCGSHTGIRINLDLIALPWHLWSTTTTWTFVYICNVPTSHRLFLEVLFALTGVATDDWVYIDKSRPIFVCKYCPEPKRETVRVVGL